MSDEVKMAETIVELKMENADLRGQLNYDSTEFILLRQEITWLEQENAELKKKLEYNVNALSKADAMIIELEKALKEAGLKDE